MTMPRAADAIGAGLRRVFAVSTDIDAELSAMLRQLDALP